MAFALIIVEPLGQRRTRTGAEGRDAYASMLRFSEDLKSRGLLTIAQSLKSETEAVRVCARGGKPTLIDGPFAEAKEIVGGILLLTCDSREQAVEIAGQCPAAQWGTVEVRELGPCFS